MKIKDRQKICSHCEGRIAVEADTCLYCGMPLLSAEVPKGSLESLYPPPYSTRIGEEGGGNVSTSPDYMSQFQTQIRETVEPENTLKPSEGAAFEESASFAPIFLSLLGTNLFILGLMQCFFSEGGFLRLEWNTQYWFILCLISLPLLYFGMIKTSHK